MLSFLSAFTFIQGQGTGGSHWKRAQTIPPSMGLLAGEEWESYTFLPLILSVDSGAFFRTEDSNKNQIPPGLGPTFSPDLR